MSTPAQHSPADDPGRALPLPGDAAAQAAAITTIPAAHTAAAARGFWSRSNPPLLALGLQGDYIWVGLTEVPGASPVLDLRGAIEGKLAGQVLIPLDEVLRMRVGFSDGDRRDYDMTFWRMGSKTPLALTPPLNNWTDYTQLMRAVGRVMAAQTHDGGLARITGGNSKFEALLLPVLFGGLLAAALFLSIFVLAGEPWYGRLIVPSVPLVLFVIFTMVCIKYQWPRPLRTLEELDRQLPPDATHTTYGRGLLAWLKGRKAKG